MSTNGSIAAPKKSAAFDVDALKANLAKLTAKQKRLVLYWLLHDLLGDRPQQESGVFDPDEFLYMCLVPPGKREYFRFLEHPGLEGQLDEADKGPSFSLEQIREELGVSELFKNMEKNAAKQERKGNQARKKHAKK